MTTTMRYFFLYFFIFWKLKQCHPGKCLTTQTFSGKLNFLCVKNKGGLTTWSVQTSIPGYKLTSLLIFDLKHFSCVMRNNYHHFSCSLRLLPPNKVILITLHNLSGPLAAFSPRLTRSYCCFTAYNTDAYDRQETKHRTRHMKAWNHGKIKDYFLVLRE